MAVPKKKRSKRLVNFRKHYHFKFFLKKNLSKLYFSKNYVVSKKFKKFWQNDQSITLLSILKGSE